MFRVLDCDKSLYRGGLWILAESLHTPSLWFWMQRRLLFQLLKADQRISLIVPITRLWNDLDNEDDNFTCSCAIELVKDTEFYHKLEHNVEVCSISKAFYSIKITFSPGIEMWSVSGFIISTRTLINAEHAAIKSLSQKKIHPKSHK